MGKKLNSNKSFESFAAAQKFKRDVIGEDYKIKANVIVLDRNNQDIDNYIYNIEVDVLIANYNIYQRVDIMWEDALGSNYKSNDPKLFGYYSSDYCEMIYNYKELTIYADDRKIIVRG